MFAVVNHLHFSKAVDEFRSVIEESGLPLLSSYPGFVNFYFVKETEDRGIVILLWQDAASAVKGAQSFGPTWFAENFRPFLIGDEQRSTGEVLVSYRE